MAEFKEMIKKTNIQIDNSQTIGKYNKESFSTRGQLNQNTLVQSKTLKEAISIIGETISDIDLEIEQKNGKQFLEDKKGLPDSKVIEEMNRLDLNKICNKEKNDMIMHKLNKTFTIKNT